MNKSSLLLLLFLSSVELQAQWKQLNVGIAGEINAVSVTPSSVFAGTDAGIYRSTDNGASWKTINSSFTVCIVASGSNIFAGTASGVILSTDNGNTWSTTSMTSSVNALALKDTNIFAVGGGIFRSTNKGVSWKAVDSGLVGNQNSVTNIAVSDNKLYACTYAGVCLSTDNGDHWTGLSYQLFTNCVTVNGSTIFAGTPGGMVRSTDNGTSWNDDNNGFPLESSGFRPSILSFAAVGSNTFTGTTSGVFLSTDYGTSWTAVNNGLPASPSQVFSLAARDSNLFAATYKGVFFSTNNGTSWTSTNVGIIGSEVFSLVGDGSNIFAHTNSSVFASTNNGADWADVDSTLPSTYIQSFTVDASNVFAVATFNGIFISSNHGKTWDSINGGIMDTTHPIALVTSGPNLVAATQDHGLFYSSNSGTSWIVSNGGPRYPRSLSSIDSNIFVGGDNGLFLSTDHGESWAIVNDTLVDISVFASSGSNIFGGSPLLPSCGLCPPPPPSGLFRSTDNGKSWVLLTSGIPKASLTFSLAAEGSVIIVAMDQRVYCSTNSGDTWDNVTEGLPDIAVLSLFSNESNVFVGTERAGIWQRPLTEITAVKQPISTTMPTAFRLQQNFPNPFNPTTIISYELPADNVVSLEVYDMLGRKVKTLLSERQSAGAHSVTFNASSFSSGVYFYRLTTGNFVETKKLILIK